MQLEKLEVNLGLEKNEVHISERWRRGESMKLGELIRRLQSFDGNDRIVIDIDGKYHNPLCLSSFRGYYDQLAIDQTSNDEKKLGIFLKECEEAVGKVFTGWKGGDFTMYEHTLVWVSEIGCCDNIIITDIIYVDSDVVIKTMVNDYA